MNEAIQFLRQHGYALLFGWVLIEQMGLPLPVPWLLAAGALAGSGRMDLTLVMGAAVGAVVMADMFWYQLGRHGGRRILRLLAVYPSNRTRASDGPKTCSHDTRPILYSWPSLFRV